MRKRVTLGMSGVVFCLIVVPLTMAADLSLEGRIEAQRSIEQVFWNHRIWPSSNPGPKPPLSAVMLDEELRARVEDYLKKSQALEDFWGRPVTEEQLQAELNRMAARTRDAGVLRELFEALGDDPRLIAETLGRQLLVDRLIRNWYSTDPRWHGETKSKALETLAHCSEAQCLPLQGATFQKTDWKLRIKGKARRQGEITETGVLLDFEEWKGHLANLGQRFGAAPDALPVGEVSRLEETPTGFVATAVLRQDAEEIQTATVTWKKTPFEAWWETKKTQLAGRVLESADSFSLPAIVESDCTDDTWASMSIGSPDGRQGHTAVWTGTEMIIWGGKNNWIKHDSGGRYNPATDNWEATSLAENLPAKREGHSAVWTGTEMIIWGGNDGGELLNSGARYDPVADRWTPLPTGDHCPPPRIGHTVVWTGSEMIVWGGTSLDGYQNTGGRFNPETGEWKETSTANGTPLARIGHTAVWSGSEMIIWGGEGIGVYFNTGGRYDPVKDTWAPTSTGTYVPGGRVGHVAVWTGSEMVVWGGSALLYIYNNGGHYDPVLDKWSYVGLGAGLPTARFGHTAVWTGTEMIIWGGHNGFEFEASGSRYNPSTREWYEIPGYLSPRTKHAAVWAGTEMIVWGGYDGMPIDTGARYRPDSDTWVPTSRGQAPNPRNDCSVVWTGTEVIVWGGTSQQGNENTGSRYTPSTDTWASTSCGANVPAPRSQHVGVWTGEVLVIWGGIYGDGYFLITGGRYSPTTDTWLPTSIGSETPQHRAYASGVWTGKEVLIWGGSGVVDLMNTGSSYNPSNDKWKLISTVGPVPGKRIFHTALWTGKEMLVWGGFGWDGAHYTQLGSGSRYNPTVDMWYSISLDGAPTRREGHRAVWTGSEMIIWGGYGWDLSEDNILNTGGRYNPNRNSWVATSTTNGELPVSRVEHSAVWTGAEMLVWGGEHDYNQDLNSGGRYDPFQDTWKAMSRGVNLPLARYSHAAVFTGSEMLIWGGMPITGTGGRYCVGQKMVLSLNEGAEFSTSRKVKVRVSASGSPDAEKMCLSETASCAEWQKYSETKNFHLTPSLGQKTVNCWIKTESGVVLPSISDTIILDTAKPREGELTGTRNGDTCEMSWAGFTDEGTGIAQYILMRKAGSSPPANCRSGTPIYEGEGTTFTDSGLLPTVKYGYRVCPVDRAGNVGNGKTFVAKP